MHAHPVLFEVAGLCKSYRAPSGQIDVLHDVSFHVRRGEFLAIVGESGSGKSTLLQLIGTLDRPDSGRARLGEHLLFEMGAREQASVRNREIGFVYQAHHLIPELTALENAMLPLQIGGVPLEEARSRACALLRRIGLGERLEHIPARLSGGEAQRVAVARALVGRPRLLLADEPTGNLDERTAQEVFSLLRELCVEEQASVMMVTHSRTMADACDRVLQLKHGVIVDAVDAAQV